MASPAVSLKQCLLDAFVAHVHVHAAQACSVLPALCVLPCKAVAALEYSSQTRPWSCAESCKTVQGQVGLVDAALSCVAVLNNDPITGEHCSLIHKRVPFTCMLCALCVRRCSASQLAACASRLLRPLAVEVPVLL